MLDSRSKVHGMDGLKDMVVDITYRVAESSSMALFSHAVLYIPESGTSSGKEVNDDEEGLCNGRNVVYSTRISTFINPVPSCLGQL